MQLPLKLCAFFIALFSVFYHDLVAADTPSAISRGERIVIDLYKGGGGIAFKERIRRLTDDERSLAIEHLREMVNSTIRKHPSDADRLNSRAILEMAMLGDDWAVVHSANDFLAKRRRVSLDGMLLLGSPKTIPLVGGALFKEDRVVGMGHVMNEPIQVEVNMLILHILGESSEFSEEVRSWARRTAVRRGALVAVREWYRLNEDKLKARDFKAVQPGSEPATSDTTAPVNVQAPPPPPSRPHSGSSENSSNSSPAFDLFGSGYLRIWVLFLSICGWIAWRVLKSRARK